MKFHRSLIILILFLQIGAKSAWGTPSIEEIESDIEEFQNYFKQRFPEIALKQYNDGVNALPQYADRVTTWELLSVSPPFDSEMVIARQEWATPFENGYTFSDCFNTHPGANKFPYFKAGRVFTIVGVINRCLSDQGEFPLKYEPAKSARLVAAFKEKFNGEAMEIDYREEGMRTVYRQGRQFYWAKRGQNNFSCASCHVYNAGNRLRDDVLSAGLGQTAGFPVYRTTWAQVEDGETIQPWGTIHRRYAACNLQAGAVPFEPQSEEYIALEVYQGIMNTGIPLKVPSLRQ